MIDFLLHADNKAIERSAVQKKIKLSKTGANIMLRELVGAGLLNKTAKGGAFFYQVNLNHPIVKQLKVLSTAVKINPLINKLKPHSSKIILFGSSSRGENLPESDIDLFVLSRNREAVKKTIKKSNLKNKIQPIIKTPIEFSELEKKDPYFYKEIDRGIVLMENYGE